MLLLVLTLLVLLLCWWCRVVDDGRLCAVTCVVVGVIGDATLVSTVVIVANVAIVRIDSVVVKGVDVVRVVGCGCVDIVVVVVIAVVYAVVVDCDGGIHVGVVYDGCVDGVGYVGVCAGAYGAGDVVVSDYVCCAFVLVIVVGVDVIVVYDIVGGVGDAAVVIVVIAVCYIVGVIGVAVAVVDVDVVVGITVIRVVTCFRWRCWCVLCRWLFC